MFNARPPSTTRSQHQITIRSTSHARCLPPRCTQGAGPLYIWVTIVQSMYFQKWPNLEQIATELFFMARYSENMQGFQKKNTKIYVGGIFSKHPLKSTSHSTHKISGRIFCLALKCFYLYIDQIVFLYNAGPHQYKFISPYPISRTLYWERCSQLTHWTLDDSWPP